MDKIKNLKLIKGGNNIYPKTYPHYPNQSLPKVVLCEVQLP